jgi:protein ImuB
VCVVRCRDWPVVVARHRDPSLVGRPIIVRERVGPREVVRSASAEARANGVTIGLRRREAEARCPGLVVLDVDTGAEAAAFELVARAVEAFTPRIELERPGLLTFPTRGPSRYFGGDAALTSVIRDAMRSRADLDLDPGAVGVGIADGRLAARLAARQGLVVAPGESAGFLAPFPVEVLGDVQLAGLLVRLGLHTLGDFGRLPEPAVLARFGPDGRRLHRLARGLDDRVTDLAPPPPDLVEQIELDPPAARVDQAAFAAKTCADRLLDRLADLGLGCSRVLVEAQTEHGETMTRCWRHEGALTPAALAERVRWQLDGWLRDAAAVRERALDGDVRERQDADALADLDGSLAPCESTTGALTLLRLVPDEVVPMGGRQLGFWGGDQAAADRADRALTRVQGMLGFEGVVTLVPQGGRTPIERVRWVPWGEPREPLRPIDAVTGPVAVETPSWPGTVPGPAPGRVFDPPVPATLLDAGGEAITVSGRGEPSAEPTTLRSAALPDGGGPITGFAGPWAHDVRWWDLSARRRRALWQLTVTTGGTDTDTDTEVACLVSVERGRAGVEAVYD